MSDWFERIWEYREEQLYPQLFGPTKRGIFVIPPDMLTVTFRQETYDPRWLHYGVIEFAPTAERQSWVYVTSGMSNAWEADEPNPSETSGLGCEFIFEVSEPGDWAITRLLQLMTFQILLCHDRYPGRQPLWLYDRMPLRRPVWDRDSEIQFLMMSPAGGAIPKGQLESGTFDFIRVVGITESEVVFAREHGGDKLVELLSAAGAFPTTNPARAPISLP